MANRLNRLLHGKNIKLLYYLRSFMRYAVPRRLLRLRLQHTLS